ncbi:MAG: hypothetical protein Q8M01_15825 [Rubrivivax sp.]|nr:hypothetical protein [Rubrivivax sp.]
MDIPTLTSIKAALSGLKTDQRKRRAQLEALRRERDLVAAAPAAREDIKAALRAYIGAGGERYTVLLQRALAPLVAKPIMLADPERVAGVFGLVAATAPQGNPTPRGFDMVLSSLAAELTVAALDRAVDGMAWPAPEGLPMAQRQAELTRLDGLIAKLEAEEENVAAQARDAGLMLGD